MLAKEVLSRHLPVTLICAAALWLVVACGSEGPENATPGTKIQFPHVAKF